MHSPRSNRTKFSLIAVAVIVIIIILLLRGCHQQSRKAAELRKYQKTAWSILGTTWDHFKNREGFEGDWWSEKFNHSKMILWDGRPNAFMDGGDQDNDGIKDIDWSDPKKPFELAVVSESGSYALLRAVWMKDRQTFDRVWRWTKNNLQHSEIKYVYFWKDVNSPENGWRRVEELGIDRDALFAWRWTPTIAERDRKGVREDGIIYYRWQPPSEGNNPNDPWRDGWDPATDADQDIALALIYADKLWGSKRGDRVLDYAANARQILNDIWKKETYVKGDYRYLAGGTNIRSIEPGYLSPFSYRVFDDFDPDHHWLDLVDSSYRIFRDSSTAMLSSWIDKRGISHNQNPHKRQRWPRANLVPDWLSLDKNGQIVDGAEREEAEFGTDAFRALWRVAVDYGWYRDKRAAEYLKQHSNSGPYDFLYFRLHDKRGDWKKTPNYNESQKLASVYWHDGSYTMYEGNYEPEPGKNYVENQTASRANCGQYGVYLSYFYASYLLDPNPKSFDMIERLLYPLITPEANGFSKRSYVIPEDQLKMETARNIARQTPPEKRNPKAEIGIPYQKGDGWYCTDKAGGYWTIFDHSEWNSQMDYYSNTWTWLGLAFFAGVVRNFYQAENKVPDIQDFDVYLDREYQYKAMDHINAENFFILAKGKDRNPRHRDFFYIKVETTQKGAKPINLKVVETAPNSGLFKAMGFVGLESSDAADRVAGSVGKYLTFIDSDKPSLRKTYRIGQLNLTQVIEDFEDGSPFDANPMAWWTDSLKPDSGKPKFVVGKDKGIYIWKDKEWHIRFLGNSGHDVFSGMIMTDGYIDSAKAVDQHAKDSIQTLKKSINFTCVEDKTSTGIDFTVQGQFVIFDIKFNGYYESSAFAIGANRDTAFGAPLVLRNTGETGTYKLKLNKEKAVNSRFSLQSDKKYIGKPYPYLGGVLFNAEHTDWTKFDEFSFDLYLERDVGPIRVDIQDAKGTVGILNDYNPWNDRKGAGWYKWRSNHPYGIGVNAGLVEPFSIRYRNWWKGWSFDENRNVERTKELDLSKIRNIMWCIHGGAEDSSRILMDNLTLERVNYYIGHVAPKSIRRVTLYSDEDYKHVLDPKKLLAQEKVYVEVVGKDGAPDTYDKFKMKLRTTDRYPGCSDISIQLLETSENSGKYRGAFTVGLLSREAANQIGAAQGNVVTLQPENHKRHSVRLKVGSFVISTKIDGFDDLSAGQDPESWWVDTLDPASGRPIYPAGAKLGYFLWKEGDVWKMRWSSDQTKHHFTGSLVTDKNIRILQKNYIQGSDRIEQVSNHEIQFDTNEQWAEDGFDFTTDGSFVKFNPLIDGSKYPYLVWVGPNDWNKAYSIPFAIKNAGKTRTYRLSVSNKLSVSKPNSLQVNKTFFDKEYPYFGKWGLSGDLMNWTDKSAFTMWVYLKENAGNIRVDIEDTNRQTAVVNEYNPWDPKKGSGWYLWTSSSQTGQAVAERKIDPKPLKDRSFWSSYDTHLEKNIDVTRKINLSQILNVEFSTGGGLKQNSVLNMDNMQLVRINRHLGATHPKRVNEIRLFSDGAYHQQVHRIQNQIVYVELHGQDGDSSAQDKIFLDVYTSDSTAVQKSMMVTLTETGANTGVYRGVFRIGLETHDDNDMIAAQWHSILSLIPREAGKYVKKVEVGLTQLKYSIDDFKDGDVEDKYPVTWWISGEKEKSYQLFPGKSGQRNVMRVSKKYVGDKYPYFGAWGLQEGVEKWSDKDDFVMEMYLKKDPGQIRVDIQDKDGTIAVLNGFNPWEDAKGEGWYTWRASKGIGHDYKNGYVDLKKIRQRDFWMGWDEKQKSYVDQTRVIDLDHIQNVQLLVDPEGEQPKELWIADVYLTHWNFYFGNSTPKLISHTNFYHDPSYEVPVSEKGSIIFRDVYAQVNGIDSDPGRVDVFPVQAMVWTSPNVYPVWITLQETDMKSGVYRAKIDLSTLRHPKTRKSPVPGDLLSLKYKGKNLTRKVPIESLIAFDQRKLDVLKSIHRAKAGGVSHGWWILLLILLGATGVYYVSRSRRRR